MKRFCDHKSLKRQSELKMFTAEHLHSTRSCSYTTSKKIKVRYLL